MPVLIFLASVACAFVHSLTLSQAIAIFNRIKCFRSVDHCHSNVGCSNTEADPGICNRVGGNHAERGARAYIGGLHGGCAPSGVQGQSRPLGVFEVFGRTRPRILRGRHFKCRICV